MTCQSCGSPTRVGASFCGGCGARLVATPAASAVTPVPAVEQAAPALSPPPPPPPAPPSAGPPPPVLPRVTPALPPAPEAPAPVLTRQLVVEVSPAAVSSSTGPAVGMIAMPPGLVAAQTTPTSVPLVVVAPVPTTSIPNDELDDRTRVAPPRQPRVAWHLVLPDGTTHSLSGTTVIGRQPDVAAAPGATATLAIDDPDGLVSKSHAVLELDSGHLAVRDLGSTNGVVALAPDGSEVEVGTDTATPLDDGFELELGGFVIRVEKV